MFTHHAFLMKRKSGIVIPQNAIIPLRGAGAVPSGFTIWTTADAKYIIGAGSTYAVGATGGGSAITLTVSNPGNHTVGLSGFRAGGGSTAGATADGSHAHTGTSITVTPPYTQRRLIQCDADIVDLPQDASFFLHTDAAQSGLTLDDGSDNYFVANTADGSGGSLTPAATLGADWGTHYHGGISGGSTGGSSGSNWKGQVPGTHQHTATMSLTINLYRVALNAWYSAASSVNINDYTNPIIMFPSTTPPDGWLLCNGSNGTPDMRDHFIQHAASGSTAGTVSGDGTVSDSGIVSTSAGNHDHDNNDKCGDCSKDNAYHAAIGAAHTHTLSCSTTWLPSYYALAFMMADN
jgi:hypothetical protein